MKIKKPEEFLRQHFPDFQCAIYQHEISFFFEAKESSCGGDDVSEVPCGFVLRTRSALNCALFVRQSNSTVFHGVWLESMGPHDYTCDLFLMELHYSEFQRLDPFVSPLNLSTESVDN